MIQKRHLALSLSLLLLLLSLCACRDGKLPSLGEAPIFQKDTVYTLYDNLVRIDRFHNGLAPFVIFNSSSTVHMDENWRSWEGDYYFGYMDIHGKVVIEPTYSCSPYYNLPTYTFSCVRIKDLDSQEYLLDSKGTVLYRSGENGITSIGEVSNGYVWIETEKEDLAGSTFTVDYYRVSDMERVATFQDVRTFYENREEVSLSTVSDSGQATLISGNDHEYYNSELIHFNIREYDSGFSPSAQTWTVDLAEIKEFASARNFVYYVSPARGDQPMLATVVLFNDNSTQFYAVVDEKGNVLMAPRKDVAFPLEKKTDELAQYQFCQNLCPAQDADSQKWGYIDPRGNWMIQPQYTSAKMFSPDGYATVNETTVIDIEGNIVLAPKD